MLDIDKVRQSATKQATEMQIQVILMKYLPHPQ